MERYDSNLIGLRARVPTIKARGVFCLLRVIASQEKKLSARLGKCAGFFCVIQRYSGMRF